MNVLLVDDNRLMLEGLQNLLEAHGVQVVGMAADGLQAVDMARALRPDVILMDIRMPRCSGLAATRLIKSEMPEMQIIVLTTSTDDQDLFEAVKSGACGYLLKSIHADSLLEALTQAQEGIPPFSPGLAAKLLKEFAHISDPSGTKPAAPTLPDLDSQPNPSNPAGDAPVSRLNNRQTEVLTLVAEGSS